MNIKNLIKKIGRRLARIRYVGRFVRMAAALWRLESRIAKFDDIEKRIEAMSDGYGAAIRGLDNTARRHELALGAIQNLSIHVDNIVRDSAIVTQDFAEKMKWMGVDNDNIRARVEFVRKELMFELRKQLGVVNPEGSSTDKKAVIVPRILSTEKLNAPGPKKLNLGCGHLPMEGYVNVDARDLPGVDVVADVTALPFKKEEIDTIYAAHLMEHFSQHALMTLVLPHWFNLLKVGAELILIAPDAQAMMKGYAQGEFSFDELREVIFGGQEYDGDFHFTMFTPEAAAAMLREIGFDSVAVTAEARRNGACYEFEVHARKNYS